jgi:hypothetical protein
MDQAPRQAFLAAAVLLGERTVVMGIVNVVKTLSKSLGPVATSALARRDKFWVAFVIAGSLKIVRYLDANHVSRISHTGRAS